MEELNSENILELLGKMDDKERDILLKTFNVPTIGTLLMLNEEDKQCYIKGYRDCADAIESVFDLYIGKPSKSRADKLYEEYNSLDEESRKELSVLLYNNQAFQGYLTQILLGIVKQNMPEMLTFFKLLGIDFEKYMLDALRTGKGYKRYIVE